MLSDMYDEMRKLLDGQSLAEMEMEARRDAHELDQNPYSPGSFPALVFTDEKQKIRWPNGIV